MQALRLHRTRDEDQAEDLRVEEVPDPEPGPGEVRVRVRACGVCASDLHVAQGRTPSGPLPQILGHEAAGEVDSVGDGVEGWLPGDRVAVLMLRPCGECSYCTIGRSNLCRDGSVPGIDGDGSQATYTVVDQRFLVPLPGSVPYTQAAVLTDAVATPYHALKRGGIGDDAVCAIFGLGGLGMHAVQLAKLAGGTVIAVDVDPVNLERAPSWGADAVVDASDGAPHREIRQLTGGGADRAFEFVGSVETVDQALKSVAPGGRAVVVGLTPERLEVLPGALLVAGELELVGSFGSTAQDVNELVDLVEAGRLDLTRSVTHEIGLEESPEALSWLEHRAGEHPVRAVVTHG